MTRRLGLSALVTKELLELRRSPILLLSMLSLPVSVVVVPVALVAYLGHAAPVSAAEILADLYRVPAAPGRAGLMLTLVRAAAQVWLPMFLVLPVFLPILLAAQSIGGERERRTLEPLLATPIETWEIVLGKSLAAVIPAVAISWVAGALFCLSLDAVAWPLLHRALLPDGRWLYAGAVLAPLLSLFGNALAVAVSARVLDPRAAQNLAAMTVVPLLGALLGQLSGKLMLGTGFYLGLTLVVVLLDVALIALAVKLFDREKLLTRWR